MSEENQRREKQDRVEREMCRDGEEERGGDERACERAHQVIMVSYLY